MVAQDGEEYHALEQALPISLKANMRRFVVVVSVFKPRSALHRAVHLSSRLSGNSSSTSMLSMLSSITYQPFTRQGLTPSTFHKS